MKIAHLSDPHLMTGPFAAEPAAGLVQAIGRLLATVPPPDCVVITGDLADTGASSRDLTSAPDSMGFGSYRMKHTTDTCREPARKR